MYAIKEMKKDLKRVEAMMNVISDFADGEQTFRLCDIPTEKCSNYFTLENSWGWTDKFDFTGNSLSALCKRGLLEVVGKEDFIYEMPYSHRKSVGTRNIYRCTGYTFEDYKKTLAELVYKALLA